MRADAAFAPFAMQGLGTNPNGLSFGFGPPEMLHALAPDEPTDVRGFLPMKPARTRMTQAGMDWQEIARWDATQVPDFDVTLKKDSVIKTRMYAQSLLQATEGARTIPHAQESWPSDPS